MNPVHLASLVFLSAVMPACGSAVENDPAFWAPLDPTGATGGDGTAGDGSTPGSGGGGGNGGAPSSGSCSLQFTVTTVTDYGNYAPRNVGAIWIEDGSNQFVKTLAYWGNIRLKYLSAWRADSGMNRVDAVSSATLKYHTTHDVSWNCTDVNEQIVVDGPYSVHVEFTEQDSSGPTTSVPFDKGSNPEDVSPPNQSSFTGMHLVFNP